MLNQNQTDFFHGLFEDRWSKTVLMVISGFMTTLGLALVHSIIWFEHYGSDKKRTLQVSTCLVSLNKFILVLFFIFWERGYVFLTPPAFPGFQWFGSQFHVWRIYTLISLLFKSVTHGSAN